MNNDSFTGIRAELDFRTEKLIEVLDEQVRRIEQLERNLAALVKIVKLAVTAQEKEVDLSSSSSEQ